MKLRQRSAGVREARQNLSALIDEVKKGREILLTDRGHPVARLVPPSPAPTRPFPDLRAFRRSMPVLDPPLSQTIMAQRDDRI